METYEINDLEYYSSISNDITKRKEKIEKSLEQYNNQKLGFFDRISKKRLDEEYALLKDLEKQVNKLYYSKSEKISLSSDIMEKLKDLANSLTNEEVGELTNKLNSALTNSNYNKDEEVRKLSKDIQKQLDKMKLSGNNIQVYSDPNIEDTYKGTKTYKNIITDLESIITNNDKSYIMIERKEENNVSKSPLISDIKGLIQSGKLNKNESVNEIVKNLDDIEENLNISSKCKDTMEKIHSALTELNNTKDIDVKDVMKYLEGLYEKYSKEMKKASDFVSKFNFDDIKNQIEVKKENDKKEESKNDKMTEYQNLANELTRLRSANPQNTSRISEIVEQMRLFEIQSGLNEGELTQARDKGTLGYYKEQEDIKENAKEVQEHARYEDQLRKDALKDIRDEAERQLREEGTFDESLEFTNGDVHTKNINKEKKIQDKMNELIKLAEMPPELRGLHDLKKEGIVPKDATLDELTDTQLNDIRIGYSNSSMPYMENYNKWKQREQSKTKANTIYQDYIKYKASLVNKTDGLTFEQFAQKQNVNGITTSNVSEDLKNDMIEQVARSK